MKMNQKVIGSIGFAVSVISCLLALASSITILYLHVNTLASLQEQSKTILLLLQEQLNLPSRTVSDLQEQQDKGLEEVAEKNGNVHIFQKKVLFLFSIGCKEGWKFLKSTGNCYKIIEDGKKWGDANNVCKELGLKGSLAVVQNRETQELLESLGGGGVWIGGRKVNGNWEWADGSTLLWENWHEGNPDGNRTEGFIRLLRTEAEQKWTHYNDALSWFICQYKV